MALANAQQSLVLKKRDVDEDIYNSMLEEVWERNEDQVSSGREETEGTRKVVQELLKALGTARYGCLLMQNEKTDAIAQLESLKKAVASEHERCGVEIGQLRVTYNSKIREIDELNKTIMDEGNAHKNYKMETEKKTQALFSDIQGLKEKETSLKCTVQTLQQQNDQLLLTVQAKEEQIEKWRLKVGIMSEITINATYSASLANDNTKSLAYRLCDNRKDCEGGETEI